MCFSATASLIVAGLLSIISIIGISISKNRAEYLLSLTPLFFAMQQASEGAIWFFGPAGLLGLLFTYIYLFFVYLFWPIWVPVVMMLYEQDTTRRLMMIVSLITGLCVATYMGHNLYAGGVMAVTHGLHVAYVLGLKPSLFVGFLLNALYCISTIFPFLISSRRGAWIMGIMLAVSYGVSLLFFHAYSASLWCFFGALLSGLILYMIYENE